MPVDLSQSLSKFNKALDNWSQGKVPEEVTIMQRSIAFEALTRIVEKTPVDTGRARGAWIVTVNELPGDRVRIAKAEFTPQSPSERSRDEGGRFKKVRTGRRKASPPLSEVGQSTVDKGLAKLGNIPPFSVVYISNNVTYIVLLEEGSSSQAPQGMVKITFEELRTIFE